MHGVLLQGDVVQKQSYTDPGRGLSLEPQVQRGLNLFLKLKSPAQMPALLADIDAMKDQVHEALASLHYVHFARFLPSRDFSSLMVITSYDGELKSYVMDFVAVLGDAFTAMLQYMVNAPPLPVKQYPREFWDYVQSNNVAQVQPWSAYPEMTVIDILNFQRGAR